MASAPATLRPAILVISDTASRDPSADKTTSLLEEVFAADGAGKWSTDILSKIVPDDSSQIQSAIKSWTDNHDYANLIVTSGGTGFTPKDITPESVSPLIERHAPGLVHAMLAASFQVTPFAMMARPVAGVRSQSIIITLPGSPKGAKENLQAIIKLLPHACTQAAGENSRAAHVGGVEKLEKDAGVSRDNGKTSSIQDHNHSHHHHHHHHHSHGDHSHSHGHIIPRAHTKPEDRAPQSNNPSLGPSHRHRESPYPMLSVPAAVQIILENTPTPKATTVPFSQSLIGAVIAADIQAAEAVPAYRASIVDGYAIIVDKDKKAATKGIFPVASVSHAQATSMPPPLRSGEIARITTGAPLPDNANAVVMVEDTAIRTTSRTIDPLTNSAVEEEATVEILTDAISIGENIREPGSDIPLRSTILAQGDRISSLGGELGVLAASGTRNVPVFCRPRIGVLSTGDEVTDITHPGPLTGGMIRDSNRPSLISLISSWNLCADVVDLGVARDTEGELEHRLRDAIGTVSNCDVVVTTGGVSMGELDLLKPTIERRLGGTIHFGRVNMKPGKPTTFASVSVKRTGSRNSSTQNEHKDGGATRVKDEQKNDRHQKALIFSLPGNPASALVTANLFLLPCLQKLAGQTTCSGLERVTVTLRQRVKCDPVRPEYHRVTVRMERGSNSDNKNDTLSATSTGMQRSSRVGSLVGGNGLLILPAKNGWVEAGERCECLLIGPVLGW